MSIAIHTTKSINSSLLRQKLKAVLAELNELNEPIAITQDGSLAAVLIPAKEYLTQVEVEQRKREEVERLNKLVTQTWKSKKIKHYSQEEIDSATF